MLASDISQFSFLLSEEVVAALVKIGERFPSCSEGTVLGWCVDCFEMIQSAHDRGEELRMVSATEKPKKYNFGKKGI